MPDTDDFHADLFPMLDRLVAAGWASGWTCTSDGMHVRWSEGSADELGGEAKFLGFVQLLTELCPERPLTETDQAMMVIYEQSIYDRLEELEDE